MSDDSPTLGGFVSNWITKGTSPPIEGDHPVWEMAQRYHRTEHGTPLRFDRQPYLIDLYKSWPRRPPHGFWACVKKVPQEGISEMALCLVCTYAGELGARIFYVLPKYELRNKFVKTRVDKTIAFTKRYKDRLALSTVRSDSLHIKHFGRKGTIIFPSSNVANDFIAFGCDIAVIDEINKCVKENIVLIDDRMSGFDSWRVRLDISTPTTREEGIAPIFAKSDQRRWHQTCDNCGELQVLTWWDNVVEADSMTQNYVLRDKEWEETSEDDIRVFCRECGAPFDRFSMGEWIPTKAGYKRVGYHMTKLYSASKTIREAWGQYQLGLDDMAEEQLFYNSVLGEDYAGGNVSFTEELLDACAKREERGYYMPQDGVPDGPWSVCAGIDVGKELHIWIGFQEEDRLRTIYLDTMKNDLELVPSIINKLRAFRVSRIVIDADPETQLVLKLKQLLNEAGEIRIWSCRFQRDDYKDITPDFKQAHLRVDRTYAFDHTLTLAKTGRLLLPANWRAIDRGKFSDSMCGPTRKKEKTDRGVVWRWSSTDYDHWRLSLVYMWLASTLLPVRLETDFEMAGLTEGRVFTGDPMSNFGFGDGGMGMGTEGGRIF